MNANASATTAARVVKSQRYFNKASLFVYDWVLYGVISKYAWGSSVKRLDAHYAKYISANHLEVGVGTGYLLNRVVFPSPAPRLALMDLSHECLIKTQRKVQRYQPAIYQQNLLEPINAPPQPFDSIAINYVLHCVPGSFREKQIVFEHLQPLLSSSGALFGTSVLSKDVNKNLLAKPFMWLMNAIGVFNNREDAADELRAGLAEHFEVVEFQVVGVTAFFAVRQRS